MIKMINSAYAIELADPATPPRPSAPAMIASTKKAKAQLNIDRLLIKLVALGIYPPDAKAGHSVVDIMSTGALPEWHRA
jgi:hypothetical protein